MKASGALFETLLSSLYTRSPSRASAERLQLISANLENYYVSLSESNGTWNGPRRILEGRRKCLLARRSLKCPRTLCVTLVYISLERVPFVHSNCKSTLAFSAERKTPLAVSRGRVVQTIMPMPIERGNIDVSHQIKIAVYWPQKNCFCVAVGFRNCIIGLQQNYLSMEMAFLQQPKSTIRSKMLFCSILGYLQLVT